MDPTTLLPGQGVPAQQTNPLQQLGMLGMGAGGLLPPGAAQRFIQAIGEMDPKQLGLVGPQAVFQTLSMLMPNRKLVAENMLSQLFQGGAAPSASTAQAASAPAAAPRPPLMAAQNPAPGDTGLVAPAPAAPGASGSTSRVDMLAQDPKMQQALAIAAMDPEAGRIAMDMVKATQPQMKDFGPMRGQPAGTWQVDYQGNPIKYVGPSEGSQKLALGTEEELRKEYIKAVEPYGIASQARREMMNLPNNPAGDFTRIMSLARMALAKQGRINVQEIEQLGQNGSLPIHIQRMWNYYTNKGSLEGYRDQFQATADAVLETHRQDYLTSRKIYSGLASRKKLDPADVVLDIDQLPEDKDVNMDASLNFKGVGTGRRTASGIRGTPARAAIQDALSQFPGS